MLRNALLALALTLALPAAWAQDSLSDYPFNAVDVLEEAWGLTSRSFYDKRVLAAKGWDEIRARYLPRARAAQGREEVHGLINEMLGELKTSHLALVDGEVFKRYLDSEFQDRKTPQLGCELVELESQLFIGSVLEGSAAAEAGLCVGDRVLRIDGLPALDAGQLRGAGHDPGLPGPPGHVLLVEDEEEVVLTIQRAKDGPVEDVAVRAGLTNMISAVTRSVRIIERGKRKIGVIHLWHFMSSRITSALKSALRGRLSACDGLILDIRGRGGSTQVVNEILELFQSGRQRLWDRPVVVLQHHETRSAKEIFAFKWKALKLGPVIGETSQGACIGTVFRPLRDGSTILLPAVGVTRLTGGVELEGRGVDPDIFVEVAPLPFKQGTDEILERGLTVIAERIELAPRRARVFH